MFPTLQILRRPTVWFPFSIRVLRMRSTTNSDDTSTSAYTPSNEKHSRTTVIQQTYQNKKYNCEFNWTIPNFKIYHDTELYSRPFSPDNHNYEWILKLDVPYRNDGNVRLYLKPASNCVEQFGEASGNVQAGLVSSQGEKICIQEQIFNTERRKYSLDPEVNILRIQRDDLLEETNESLLSQGALKIFCNLSFAVLKEKDTSSNESKDFEKYFNDRESSDLTINVDGKIYPAHKFVLAAHSPAFEAMFAHHDKKENQPSHIEIEDVDEKVFAEMLRYMYTGYVENLQAIALDLAIAADKYNMKKLKSLCEWKIGASVTAETAVRALISSELYNLHKAKKNILEYIKNNMEDVMKSGGLNNLSNHPKLWISLILIHHEENTELREAIADGDFY